MAKAFKSTFTLFCVVRFTQDSFYIKGVVIKEEQKMNTDKIYAEHVAQEYSIKDTSQGNRT